MRITAHFISTNTGAAEERHCGGPAYHRGARRDYGSRSCAVEGDRSADSGFLVVPAPHRLLAPAITPCVDASVVSAAANSCAGFAGYGRSVVIGYPPVMGVFAMIPEAAAAAFAGTSLLRGALRQRRSKPASPRSLLPWRPTSCPRILHGRRTDER